MRSSNERAHISLGRTWSQNRVRAGPGVGCSRVSGCGGLPGAESFYFRVLRRGVAVRPLLALLLMRCYLKLLNRSTTTLAVAMGHRSSYGVPKVHAELRLGLGIRCGRKRIVRLMRQGRLQGICHRRKRRGWKPAPAVHQDLVKRQFTAQEPDRVWFCDITQHRASDGWVLRGGH